MPARSFTRLILLGLYLTIFIPGITLATIINGKVRDKSANPLSFSSILVKGTKIGTVANDQGDYRLNLAPGTYTLECRHVGYIVQERKITVTTESLQVDFILSQEDKILDEVVINNSGEDPAYEIIRNAIKSRKVHLDEINSIRCKVYVKGLIRVLSYPKKLFGQTINIPGLDTSGKNILFLSETIANYSSSLPDKVKIEVLSTHVSGQSGGLGLADPAIISFYDNLVGLDKALNPRGFISPIADNAMNFYTYKYLGSFFEGDIQINRIQVTPKRSMEPVFSGIINIIEKEWRIQSVNLKLTKESQMEICDSLRIEQLYVNLSHETWALKSQVIYPYVNIFGVKGTGYFLSTFDNIELNPTFEKKYFTSTVLRYTQGSNSRSRLYWDTLRPIPLDMEEVNELTYKDSLERLKKIPEYMDSVNRKQNRPTVTGLLVFGQTFSKDIKKISMTIRPLIEMVGFNTVEGWMFKINPTFTKELSGRRSVSVKPTIRYGLSNHHLNIYMNGQYKYGKKYQRSILLDGGKKVIQFNNENPIPTPMNTFSTLIRGWNYMKVYEMYYGRLRAEGSLGAGLGFLAEVQYQDRLPLENTDTTFWGKEKNYNYTPNYPVEIMDQNFKRHQAFFTTLILTYRPGTRYMELPERKVDLGSRYPLFYVAYRKGWDGIAGSDIRYDRWQFGLQDEMNLRLQGEMQFRASVGGFVSNNQDKVEVPDYQHFNGNQTLLSQPYLTSFQLAPYYQNSTSADFYTTIHFQYHLRGFLTNKIPGFNRLNVHLVTGVNTFYVNESKKYFEWFIGLENILKILRLDVVSGYLNGKYYETNIRIGLRDIGNPFKDE